MSKVLIRSARGSDDPTRASFPFAHANALMDAGHEVQAFLLGEAVGLLRGTLPDAIHPVGWPPLSETFAQTFACSVPVRV